MKHLLRAAWRRVATCTPPLLTCPCACLLAAAPTQFSGEDDNGPWVYKPLETEPNRYQVNGANRRVVESKTAEAQSSAVPSRVLEAWAVGLPSTPLSRRGQHCTAAQ